MKVGYVLRVTIAQRALRTLSRAGQGPSVMSQAWLSATSALLATTVWKVGHFENVQIFLLG